MNYYEQFYDDLEFTDYEEERYRHGYHDDYHGYDDVYDDPYRGHGPPRSCDDYGGHSVHYDDSYNEHERVMFERDRSRPPYDRGRGHRGRGRGDRGQGRGQSDRGRGQTDRGWGRSDRGRGQSDRGRGHWEGGQGGPARGRGRAQQVMRGARGKTQMTFVKAGVLNPDTQAAGNKHGESSGSETGNRGNSDTIRFDYKTYAAQKTPTEQEVEDALKAYSCTLGFGYGYGPRSDLNDGSAEGPSWVGQTGDTQQQADETSVPDDPEAPVEQTSLDQSSPASQSAPVVKTAMVNHKFNFVKANAEFHSIDVAFHEIPEIKPKENSLSVNMGNKRLGLGFGLSAKGASSSSVNVSAEFHAGQKDGSNSKFDQKFKQLHDFVKLKNVPGKNGIEVLHMAAQKVKMTLTDDIRTGGRTPTGQAMFLCRLEIDGVYVAEGHATSKKMAKHEAFANGVKLLLQENLTVKEVSQGVFELKQRDIEFKIPFSPAVKAGAQPYKPAAQFTQGQFNKPSVSTTQGSTSVSSASSCPSQPSTQPVAPSSLTYTKPKIVFHKSSHPSADKPLNFKTPTDPPWAVGEASSLTADNSVNMSVKNPAEMAMKLLNFVKEGESSNSGNRMSDEEVGDASKQTYFQEPSGVQSFAQNWHSNKVVGQTFLGPRKGGRPSSAVYTVQSSNRPGNKRQLQHTGGMDHQGRLKVRRKDTTHTLDDLSQFIIIENAGVELNQSLNASSILHNSGNFNKVVLKVEYEACEGGTNCNYVIGDHHMATALGVNKEDAKQNAAIAALEELRDMCYTIRVKQQVDSDGAGLSKEELMSDIQQGGEMLPDSNIGNMLLRKMGWAGGGVGRSGQGIAEPVKAEMMIGREGLGLKAARGVGRDFNKKVTTLLEDYIKSENQEDLYFSSELSKEERAIIHTIGQKMGLKTQSKGKNENRYLIVSRRRSAQELLDHVISSGGTTSKYEVLSPGSADMDCRKREDITFGHCKQ